MALPQRKQPQRKPYNRPARPKTNRRGNDRRGEDARRRGRFLLFVVIPAVLMLGSVYTHTAAGDLQERTSQLQETRRLAEAENQRLELRVEELTAPGRITSLAKERLNMRQPAENLKVYGGSAEGDNEGSR